MEETLIAGNADFFLALWSVLGILFVQYFSKNQDRINRNNKALHKALFETYFPLGTVLFLVVAGPIVWFGLCAYGVFVAIVMFGMKIGYALDESL